MNPNLTMLLSTVIVPLLVSGTVIFDFSSPQDMEEWRIVNDGVMGGLSSSELLAAGDSSAVFRGVLSLRNNGGFASVRSGIGAYDLSAYEGIELRVLGDGRRYQLRLRTDSRYDGVAYKYEFKTEKGEWMGVKAPFGEFEATFRGRVLEDYRPLDTADIRQFGFLIGDGMEGPFRLEIDSVTAYSTSGVDQE